MPICPTAHLQKFEEMETGHFWYPIRALKVPLSPKRPSTHLPRCPYANIWGNGHKALGVAHPFPPNVPFCQMPICPGAHFLRCPLAPNIHFTQESISPKSPFTLLSICPERFFAICSVPTCPGTHLPQVPICPKCPFTPNSPYPQMPIG